MPAPKQTKVKFPRAKADKIIKKVEKHIKPFVDRQMACGSYRRGAQMIGDIDFVVIPKEGVTLPQMLPPNEGINWVGDNKAQVIIDGEKVDFKVTTPEAWGATILYFTGPADFNIKYRWMAKKRGMKLNEYGLFDRTTDAYIAGATEQDIYDALKRPFRDPDQRTGWKRAEYQPNQELSDYTPYGLMTSSVITGDYTVDSLKYSQTTLSAETGGWGTLIELIDDFPNAKNLDALALDHSNSFVPRQELTSLNSMQELLEIENMDPWGKKSYYINFPLTVFRGVNTRGKNQQWTWKRWLDDTHMGTSQNMGIDNTQPTTLNIQEALDYAMAPGTASADYELYAIDIQDYFIKIPRPSVEYKHRTCNSVHKCRDCNTEYDSDKSQFKVCCGSYVNFLSCDNPNHITTETPVIFILGGAHNDDMQVLWDADMLPAHSAETFGSENQWIVDKLTMLLTQRARTLSELIDDLGIRGITVESNLVRNSTFVRVGKHVPAVWGLSGQDYSRKHPYNAISPAAGRRQHLKSMFEKLDPREKDWDDDVTWNHKQPEPDWSDEVEWDAEEIEPRCPICFGFIPNNADPGAYFGAMSRYDDVTEICSSCGQAEGMLGLFLGSVDKDKLKDAEAIKDPWLRHTYLINLVKDVIPPAFRGE